MDTNTRILQKADEMFRRYGIRAVTLDEIASALGISKKTIYQFFEDKDALVDAVMMAEFDHTQKECCKASLTAKDAVDEIFQLMKSIDEDFRNINPIIIFDLKKFHFKTFEKFEKHLHQDILQMIVTNLKRGIKEGLYRDDLDVEIVARFRVATIWLMFDQEVFPATKFQLTHVARQVFELFLHGLVNAKGNKLIEKYKTTKF
jgi:TetR/AcrR family transcriptional regulator, cholesterol catabolism regulator